LVQEYELEGRRGWQVRVKLRRWPGRRHYGYGAGGAPGTLETDGSLLPSLPACSRK
jgi:hypothetical protein